jgi:hypothetical protein
MASIRTSALRIVVWLELSLFFLPVLAWPFLALMSILSFDAPGSENNPILLSMVTVALGYPMLYFFGATRARQKLKENEVSTALQFASLPVLAFVAFGVLYWLLKVMCGGTFTCR